METALQAMPARQEEEVDGEEAGPSDVLADVANAVARLEEGMSRVEAAIFKDQIRRQNSDHDVHIVAMFPDEHLAEAAFSVLSDKYASTSLKLSVAGNMIRVGGPLRLLNMVRRRMTNMGAEVFRAG